MRRNRLWDGLRRAGFVIFMAYGIAAIVGAVTHLFRGTITDWVIAAIGVVCVAALESYRFWVGGPPYRSLSFTLPVIALPILAPMLGDPAAVGVLAIGTAVRAIARTHRWSFSAYASGLVGVGATVNLVVFHALRGADVAQVMAVLIAAVAFVVTILTVETGRRMSIAAPWVFDAAVPTSPLRVAIVFVGAAGLTALASLWNNPALPYFDESVQARNALVVLLLLTLVTVAARGSVRLANMRRRFNGLIRGTAALNAKSFSHAADSESFADLLRRAVGEAIGAETVNLRSHPGDPHDIAAAVTLVEGQLLFIVAHRDGMDVAFSRDDQLALNALAHTTDVVVQTRDDIGGLTLRANTDPLTGLPNYGAFQEALANINDHRGYSEALAVLFLDLDDFKRLNDRLGHQAGDDVLRALGHRLHLAVRPFDVVARVGGDEFVIILTRLSSLAEAKLLAESIMAASGEPMVIDNTTVHPLLSIGLAYSAHRETDVSQLVVDADRSMLSVKESRRSGGPAHESSISISDHRSPQVNDSVIDAIRENRLEMAYQPIVSLVTSQIWAFEALVRFSDPEIGSLSPPALVAKAKGLGLLDDLTRQVAEKAMAAAAAFRLVEPRILCMTVNVEAMQVLPERLGIFVEELAHRYPEISLCLELNERSVARVSPALRAQVDHLRDIGILIALDDYGSEDSSVDSLVRVPMDILKIDKSLVDDLDDVRQQEVLMALQGFGDNLEYSMIVEGVEDEVMASHLTRLGIRGAQGFHYGTPQSTEDTLARLEKHGVEAVVPHQPFVPENTAPPLVSLAEDNDAVAVSGP
ncbi:EAL domain-containing protein [Cryobacterium psychrophilum]|uniref:EAL domain-containing protein n=1 Tax=Cryobacterium psychrophilum TaxID=41988 RepID=UPI001416FE70|nr:EAL domain-containing protein [Cryobacterium psychrophilum]